MKAQEPGAAFVSVIIALSAAGGSRRSSHWISDSV